MIYRFCILVTVFCCFLPYGQAQAQKEAEVIHWWVSGGEKQALQTVIDAFEASGSTWVDTPVESSYYAKSAAISRILDGKPPAAVQWHAGVSLKEMYKEGLFREINELAEEQGWQDILPKAIWDNITVDGKMVAVPITLHGSNWIWANKKVLDAVGIGIPESWQDFLRDAPMIAEAGYFPLALGSQSWQERVLFISVVLDVAGAEIYEAAFIHHKPEAFSTPGMLNALKTFRMLSQHVDQDSSGRNWSDTTKLVIEGKAAFQVMGDWAKGEFFQAGMVPGKDFLCSLSPGSKGAYIVVVDAFAMGNVTDKMVRSTQLDLAEILMDKEVQKQFNQIKGSVAPRSDVSDDGFDACAKLAISTVTGKGTPYPGFNMANTGIVASGIMSAISSYWNDPSITPEDAAQMLAKAVSAAGM